MTPFVVSLALVGLVIVVAALFSGLVDRFRVPQVALFLALGAALGPSGLGLVDFGLTSPVLEGIATIGLVLVLFSDAISLDPRAVRNHARLAVLVLGPGTVLTAGIITLAAWGLLGLAPPLAVMLGAALASTDPVMMRGLLRSESVPAAARQALKLESGLNDLVLLPIVLLAMALAGGAASAAPLGRQAVGLLVFGPGAGVLVGFVGVALLEGVRKRVGVRRDYESIYALGLAFTAFAAAEAVHGSGFLAAFAAGLTIVAFDAELCDCFVDYGQATAEMFLLFTFVAFGASLVWAGLDALTWRTLTFVMVALFGRSLVLAVALRREPLDPHSRRLIVWYGPRGLSSLLLVLLPVFAGVPGAAALFPPAALAVLASIVLHGGALMLGGRTGPPIGDEGRGTKEESAPQAAAPTRSRERITLDELKQLQARGERVVLLDVRKESAWGDSLVKALGAIRLPPDSARTRAAELALPRHDWLVAYCA
jgi:NhaP-type Na+/H+ or K+/H+ antiporter